MQKQQNELEPMRTVRLIGVATAEAIYGISRWTIRRWAYSGKIASTKLGKRLLIPTAEMERLVTENTRPRLAEERQ